MNCEKCFHNEVCEKHNRLVQIDEHTWEEYVNLDDVEKFCKHFANKDDVVKVIRCKNCSVRKTNDCAMHFECDCGNIVDWECSEDFCSYGTV